MSRIIQFTLLLFIIASCQLFGQSVEKKFGTVFAEDFNFPLGIEDSTAGAVFLLDEGVSTYDNNFEVVFSYHARILILKSAEFERAEIEIPYPSNGYVRNLKASAFNLVDGKVKESAVSKKEIYTDKVTSDTHKEVFTIPNVKEGTIIEYSYTVSQGSFRSLNTWFFQSDVPVVYSEYRVEMPDFFIYKQTLTGFLSVTDYDTFARNGTIGSQNYSIIVKKFIMLNVPAFVEEPFMRSRKDNVSSIRFEMVSYQYPGQLVETVAPANYYQLSTGLAKNTYYGSIYKRNGYYNEILEDLTQGISDSLEMIMAIYSYVQDEFEVDDEMITSNLRTIFKEKKGWAQDINMVLAGMLYNLDFDVSLVRVSTKRNGIPNPFYATVKNFNYTICLVEVGGKEYLLDAAPDHLPFGSLAPTSVNDKGLLISEDKPRWIDLVYGDRATLKCTADLTLDEKGALVGAIDSYRDGYAAYHFKNQYYPNTIASYKENMAESHPSWMIDEHEVTVQGGRVAEKIAFNAEPEFNEALDDIYFKPIFYQRTTDNPFKLDSRKYSVSLLEPAYEALIYIIHIPEGYGVVSVPETMSVRLPGNKCSYLFSCAVADNDIKLTSLFQVTDTEFNQDEYLYLKEFWAQVVEKQSEEIHLRKTAN
jgi:hypothetical protein